MIVCYISGGGARFYIAQSEQSNYPMSITSTSTQNPTNQGGSQSHSRRVHIKFEPAVTGCRSHICHRTETVHTRLTQLGPHNYTYTLRHTVKDAWNSALHPFRV